MIEKYILQYLGGVLDVPVYVEIPEQPPASYVAIQKTSSSYANGLETAQVALQSCASTLYDAALLNKEVKNYMKNMPQTTRNVFAVSLNSDYNWTNTNTKVRRYQAVFDITYK